VHCNQIKINAFYNLSFETVLNRPYGFGRPEDQGNGKWYCCPTPPVSPEQCRSNIVVKTEYVKLVHKDCPTAYSYSYDDEAGLHNCPNEVNFEVNFCI